MLLSVLAGGGLSDPCFDLRELDLHLLSDRVRLRDWSGRRCVASELHYMLPRRSFYLGFYLIPAASELHARLARSGLRLRFSTLSLRVNLSRSSCCLGSAASELHLG